MSDSAARIAGSVIGAKLADAPGDLEQALAHLLAGDLAEVPDEIDLVAGKPGC